MAGLDMVKGPHWSQILNLFGPQGTISDILKDRTQVQLKDKARNLKLFFLKTESEMPYYLQSVTGELKTRAPGQAARKEAEEKARMNTEEEQARLQGIMTLAGGLQNHHPTGSASIPATSRVSATGNHAATAPKAGAATIAPAIAMAHPAPAESEPVEHKASSQAINSLTARKSSPWKSGGQPHAPPQAQSTQSPAHGSPARSQSQQQQQLAVSSQPPRQHQHKQDSQVSSQEQRPLQQQRVQQPDLTKGHHQLQAQQQQAQQQQVLSQVAQQEALAAQVNKSPDEVQAPPQSNTSWAAPSAGGDSRPQHRKLSAPSVNDPRPKSEANSPSAEPLSGLPPRPPNHHSSNDAGDLKFLQNLHAALSAATASHSGSHVAPAATAASAAPASRGLG